jgi:hypothetical protein
MGYRVAAVDRRPQHATNYRLGNFIWAHRHSPILPYWLSVTGGRACSVDGLGIIEPASVLLNQAA